MTTEFPAWAHGEFWNGNADASAITGVPRPEVVQVTEWDDPPRRVRAEAATLYCHSLTHPETAEQVHQVFADQLEAPDGMRAQLYVIARLLLRIEHGDDPAPAPLLHRHARMLLHGA